MALNTAPTPDSRPHHRGLDQGAPQRPTGIVGEIGIEDAIVISVEEKVHARENSCARCAVRKDLTRIPCTLMLMRLVDVVPRRTRQPEPEVILFVPSWHCLVRQWIRANIFG